MTGFDASLKVGRFSSGAILILGCAVPLRILYFGVNRGAIGVDRSRTTKEQISILCFKINRNSLFVCH